MGYEIFGQPNTGIRDIKTPPNGASFLGPPTSLAGKIDKLDAGSRKRHDAIYGKLTHLEERPKILSKMVGEMKTSIDFVNSKVEDLKQRWEDKADKSNVAKLMAKIDNLENRSKRNNVVFCNIPEGTKDGFMCEGIIQDTLLNHMNLERESPLHKIKNTQNGEQSSRPIHVALLRYPDSSSD